MQGLLVLAAAEGHGNGFLTGDLGDPHVVKEVLFTAAASLIVFGLLWWKGLPPARKALQARSDRIAAELAEAERARTEGEAKRDDVQARIAHADQERERILAEARQTADALREQIVARATQEAEALKTRAATDIESSKQQAIADLRAEVAGLAMGAAEAVIARNLDPGTQSELIDGYIEQVGAQ